MQLQQAQLQKRIKVWEAVHLWASLYRKQAADGDRLLEQLGLADKRKAWFMTLSGGQKQRLFIALALVNDPDVVFLDELTTGLDPQARRAIWDLVRGIRDRGKTVLLTTHLMEEAERLCDRVAIIEHGRIVDIDSPARLVDRHCPERTVVLATDDPNAAKRFRAIPRVDTVIAPGLPIHDSGPGRRFRDGGDPLSVREPDPGHRLPHGAPQSRGRVSQTDRSLDSRLMRQNRMLRGLWKLTWLEIKIFMREPLGAFGTIGIPVLVFVVLGRMIGSRVTPPSPADSGFLRVGLPVFASVLIAISAVLSLVTIISIYREGGILKRLRATPLRPHTILTAHVVVKLLLTAITLALMVLAGKRYYPVDLDVPVFAFALALLISTWSILSIGFLIASIVPTARFAQPIGGAILYPMIGLSGLFVPIESLPPALQTVARALPLTYTVSLLQGIWRGDAWSAHVGDVAALAIVFIVCTALSAKVFRWE